MNATIFRKTIRFAISGAVGVLGLAVLSTYAADRLYVYPNGKQSDARIADDRFECHRWAVTETGFDPLDSQPYIPKGPVRVPVADNPSEGAAGKGALVGAVAGAIIGAIDDDHVGEGAAIGAVVGTIAGGVAESRGYQKVRAEAEDQAQQEADARAAERSAIAIARDDYRRAISACLAGRNYTVK